MEDNVLISKISFLEKKNTCDRKTEDLSGIHVERDGIKVTLTTFSFNFLTFYA